MCIHFTEVTLSLSVSGIFFYTTIQRSHWVFHMNKILKVVYQIEMTVCGMNALVVSSKIMQLFTW